MSAMTVGMPTTPVAPAAKSLTRVPLMDRARVMRPYRAREPVAQVR
jgi:hypothetical protein